MKKLIYIQIAIVFLLSSCLVGKRYARPEMEVPQKYLSGDTLVVTGDTTSAFAAKDTTLNLQWFELFNDTVLNKIITQALDSNTNLNIAVLRVNQSRSVYKNSKASQWPAFGYKASANIADPAADNFQLLGTASWEIDFWGKIRHAKRAAYAEMIASEEGLKTIKTTIVSDVASLYFQLRDIDNRIEVTIRTIASRKTYYDMVNERFLKGESAELDKLQAEQQLALAEATLSSLQRELSLFLEELQMLTRF
jgi:multidrug efflux system outer membrane protein